MLVARPRYIRISFIRLGEDVGVATIKIKLHTHTQGNLILGESEALACFFTFRKSAGISDSLHDYSTTSK